MCRRFWLSADVYCSTYGGLLRVFIDVNTALCHLSLLSIGIMSGRTGGLDPQLFGVGNGLPIL